MQINLRQIEAFRAFMIAGTVSKAAEIMHVTQPAVSRLLSDFEHCVNFKLFERDRKRLVPTNDCEALYREVEKSYAGLEHIRRSAESIAEMKTGKLRIAAMPIFTTTFLPNVISQYARMFPNIKISMWNWPREEVIEWVLSQQFDLGFVTLPSDEEALHVIEFPVDDAVCLLPEEHPLARKHEIFIEDLHGQDFIAMASNVFFRRRLDDLLKKHKVKLNIRVEVSTAYAASKLVSAGLGISIIGFQGLGIERLPGLIVRRFRPQIPFSTGIIHSKQSSMSKSASEFLKIAQSTFEPMPR
ncbi:LysR substrate-binding domain-containing protein [Aliiglaciecola sp.]|nr:LysR substrate-binding domain-containing protein [Aliiglaciecola sp.]